VFVQDQFYFATIFSVFMHYSNNRKTVSEQLLELHFNITNTVLTGGWPVLFHTTHISTLVTKATATAAQAVCICMALGDIVAACQCGARFQLHTLCWTQLLMVHTLHSIDQHSNCSFV
jgi:hypothetical protein